MGKAGGAWAVIRMQKRNGTEVRLHWRVIAASGKTPALPLAAKRADIILRNLKIIFIRGFSIAVPDCAAQNVTGKRAS